MSAELTRSALLQAMEAQDKGAIEALLHEDVAFHSPVRSYRGREDAVHLLNVIGGIVRDAVPVRRLEDERGDVTFYEGRVDEKEAECVFCESAGEDGRIVEVTMMLRPLDSLLDGVQALGKALDADPLPSMRRN